jgi:transcriptional regulator with XRE-family HTH domain
VAQKIGVGESSIYNWENNLAKPALRYIPKIIEFLSYTPYDASAKTTGEKITACRRLIGLSQKKLACHLGIDPSTLGKWEKNKRRPSERVLKDLNTLREENIRNETKMTKREAYKINRNTRKLEKW